MSKKLKPKSVVVITDLQERVNYKKASLSPNALHTKSDIMMVSEGLRQPKLFINQREFIKNSHERKVLKLEKGNNNEQDTKSLLEGFIPYIMGDKSSSLNITKFEARGLFKFEV